MLEATRRAFPLHRTWRHTVWPGAWSSDVCSSDLEHPLAVGWGAQGAARDDVNDSEGKYRPSRWFTTKVDSRALPITLVAHLQHADLTTFVDRRKALDTWNLAYPDRAREAPSRAGWSGYRGRWLDSDVPDILRAVISASAGMVSPTPVRMVLDGANWWWARPIA